jgi:hypothetical protein
MKSTLYYKPIPIECQRTDIKNPAAENRQKGDKKVYSDLTKSIHIPY